MKLTKRQLRTLVRGSVPQYQGKVKSFNLWKRPPASQSITLDVCSISVNYFLAHIGEPERTDILSPDFYEFMTSIKRQIRQYIRDNNLYKNSSLTEHKVYTMTDDQRDKVVAEINEVKAELKKVVSREACLRSKLGDWGATS